MFIFLNIFRGRKRIEIVFDPSEVDVIYSISSIGDRIAFRTIIETVFFKLSAKIFKIVGTKTLNFLLYIVGNEGGAEKVVKDIFRTVL